MEEVATIGLPAALATRVGCHPTPKFQNLSVDLMTIAIWKLNLSRWKEGGKKDGLTVVEHVERNWQMTMQLLASAFCPD